MIDVAAVPASLSRTREVVGERNHGSLASAVVSLARGMGPADLIACDKKTLVNIPLHQSRHGYLGRTTYSFAAESTPPPLPKARQPCAAEPTVRQLAQLADQICSKLVVRVLPRRFRAVFLLPAQRVCAAYAVSTNSLALPFKCGRGLIALACMDYYMKRGTPVYLVTTKRSLLRVNGGKNVITAHRYRLVNGNHVVITLDPPHSFRPRAGCTKRISLTTSTKHTKFSASIVQDMRALTCTKVSIHTGHIPAVDPFPRLFQKFLIIDWLQFIIGFDWMSHWKSVEIRRRDEFGNIFAFGGHPPFVLPIAEDPLERTHQQLVGMCKHMLASNTPMFLRRLVRWWGVVQYPALEDSWVSVEGGRRQSQSKQLFECVAGNHTLQLFGCVSQQSLDLWLKPKGEYAGVFFQVCRHTPQHPDRVRNLFGILGSFQAGTSVLIVPYDLRARTDASHVPVSNLVLGARTLSSLFSLDCHAYQDIDQVIPPVNCVLLPAGTSLASYLNVRWHDKCERRVTCYEY